MTGKDLIIYILKNDLEDKKIKDIFNELFYTDAEYAAKNSMGIASVHVLFATGKIPGIQIKDKIYIYRSV